MMHTYSSSIQEEWHKELYWATRLRTWREAFLLANRDLFALLLGVCLLPVTKSFLTICFDRLPFRGTRRSLLSTQTLLRRLFDPILYNLRIVMPSVTRRDTMAKCWRRKEVQLTIPELMRLSGIRYRRREHKCLSLGCTAVHWRSLGCAQAFAVVASNCCRHLIS